MIQSSLRDALVAVVVAGTFAVFGAGSAGAQSEVTLQETDEGVRVAIDDETFTVYRWEDLEKPILYPVIGPHDLPMTRNYPMQDAPNEERDHRHHQSLWFGHGDVNGVTFWNTQRDPSGVIEHREIVAMRDGNPGVLKTKSDWVGPEGEVLCSDTRTIRFGASEGDRYIDFMVTIHAPAETDVTLGDTKEGTMAIRTRPELRLEAGDRARRVNGQAVNSEGVEGRPVWGKRAAWVDYWGEVEGHEVGVAIFDHRDNPRHPTWWHARHYGLVAANAFGTRFFEDRPAGQGDMHIPAGHSRTFAYRFLFHQGDHAAADIPAKYRRFSASPIQR